MGQTMEKCSTHVLDIVTLAFGIADLNQSDHVTVQVSPCPYSTWRGNCP
jgi:5-hydroxyisourate hydrolase-like protein (transthyretin family)